MRSRRAALLSSSRAASCCGWRRKHPHGRGEDSEEVNGQELVPETPPRAWGRLCRSASGRRAVEKHPHGRGEDQIHRGQSRPGQETPPRAWGRLYDIGDFRVVKGNTPTGVGKTPSRRYRHRSSRKHPHGRGEDLSLGLGLGLGFGLETPPRAWGRHQASDRQWRAVGNTPTGVGKTDLHATKSCAIRKHPHGRGEDSVASTKISTYSETPPRAWGRPPGAL